MPEGAQTVSEIAVALTLDASSFEAGLNAAQAKLESFSASSRSGPAKSISAPGSPGTYAEASARIPGIAVPLRDVTRDQWRDHRTSINERYAATGGAVSVPVKLGRTNFTEMRNEIARGIGAVPITVKLAPGSLSQGSNLNILAALQSAASGVPIGQARSVIRQAASTRGVHVEGRAIGGPVHPGVPYTVGEHGRETFVPDRAGRIIPHGNVIPTTRIQQRHDGGMTRPPGYRFRVSTGEPTDFDMRDDLVSVSAYQRGGRKRRVGSAVFVPEPYPDSGMHSAITRVAEGHQRRGIASWMYRAAEKYSGQTIYPSAVRTPDGLAFWGSGQHPFGADRAGPPEAAPGQMGMFYRPHKARRLREGGWGRDRKSTRLNSSH